MTTKKEQKKTAHITTPYKQGRVRKVIRNKSKSKQKKKDDYFRNRLTGSGSVLASRAVASQVLSALKSLTSVFGMRTGGTSPLTSPQWYISAFAGYIVFKCICIIHSFLSTVNFFTRQIHNCIVIIYIKFLKPLASIDSYIFLSFCS